MNATEIIDKLDEELDHVSDHFEEHLKEAAMNAFDLGFRFSITRTCKFCSSPPKEIIEKRYNKHGDLTGIPVCEYHFGATRRS